MAASHVRVGTFQFFAARGEMDKITALADYVITRHYPDLADTADAYLGLFRRVCLAQAALVAKWMLVGFVHGVMNTDNMAVSGETIDYGPCAFLDSYDPATVFSSIDRQGRYAYGNQPAIAQWNLSRFAETLINLVNPLDQGDAIEKLTNEINAFTSSYQDDWLTGMRAKLGLNSRILQIGRWPTLCCAQPKSRTSTTPTCSDTLQNWQRVTVGPRGPCLTTRPGLTAGQQTINAALRRKMCRMRRGPQP